MSQKGFDFGDEPPPLGAKPARPEEPAPPSRKPAPKPEPTRRRALTVSELTDRIQGVLETEFLDVWVEGEISNLKLATVRALLLLAEGRARPARGGAVPQRHAARALQAGGRHEGAGAGRAAHLPPARRLPGPGPGAGAARQGLAAAGLRGAEAEARAGGPLRPAAEAPAADAAAPDRGRDLAQRRRAARHPARAALALREPRGAGLPRAGAGRRCRGRDRAGHPRAERDRAAST